VAAGSQRKRYRIWRKARLLAAGDLEFPSSYGG
jgi:hypothetical protein